MRLLLITKITFAIVALFFSGCGAADASLVVASMAYKEKSESSITPVDLFSGFLYFPLMIKSLPPPEMVLIPAGSFLMGCSSNDTLCHKNEYPLHTIYLDAYEIDKYEVTNEQYLACVNAGVCRPPATYSSFSRPSYFRNPDFAKYPVIAVTYYQAQTFCAWLGKRLPTEAEWEKAARGIKGKRFFPWGKSVPDCNILNFEIVENNYCVNDTMAVGSFPAGASPYGVMDMAGNVWEWVADYYDPNYYFAYDPNNWPPNPTGPATGELRVVRSGAWDIVARGNRVSRREGGLPYDLDTSSGFRCARSPMIVVDPIPTPVSP